MTALPRSKHGHSIGLHPNTAARVDRRDRRPTSAGPGWRLAAVEVEVLWLELRCPGAATTPRSRR
jgi:hypothetical protein